MRKIKKGQLVLNLLLILLCVAVVAPLILVISVSFSSEADISLHGYEFIPRTFDTTAYKFIFEAPETIINAYKVTFLYSVIAMVMSVLFMSMLAYMLASPDLKGKSVISFLLYFTMLFSGGLIPTYLLNTQYLHLGDTIWIYILPTLISPWYTFMMRTFIKGIPREISESALIDGASEYRIFFTMILPLSKPVLATVALFIFLDHWNNWYTAMLYISKPKLMSLQYQLQRIMENIKVLQETENMGGNVTFTLDQIPTETARMAMAVIVAGPALLIFPFFQKYFTKGLTVGSVKG